MDLVKVIYFDEKSALDFLDLDKGGRYYFSEDKVNDYKNSTSAEGVAEVKAGSKIPFLNLLFSANADASVSREGNKLIQSTLSNTVLTDFISKLSDENGICVFKNTKVEIVKDSYAYFKVISPFTKILEKKIIETDDGNIDVTKVDEMMETSKGYYELLANKNGREFILRFDSQSFRNNYRIFDLEKMDLSYSGIKVGNCLKSELLLENQLPKDLQGQMIEKRYKSIIEAYDRYENERNQSKYQTEKTQDSDEEYLEIFDVILAGVEND